MALTDENGGMNTTMLVSPAANMPYAYPMYQSGGNGNSGFGDGQGWWIVLLIILLAAGGWNNNNGFGPNGGGMMGTGAPIIVNDGGSGSGAVQRGFDQAAVMGGVNSIQASVQSLATQLCGCCCDMQNTVNQGFNSVGTQLCNGFAGVNSNIANGFAQAEIAANGRQMANMNQAFAAQTAMAQGFNQLGSQFADCCCENRLASADLKYTIATENCADRAALSDGIRDVIANQSNGYRDIIANQTAATQRILDQLCQDKIDAKNETIAQLRQELMYSRGQASQVEQTAAILANNNAQTALFQQGFANEVDALYNRLNTCPVPTTPVYGRTPIFTCNNNGCGCGCGCGNASF